MKMSAPGTALFARAILCNWLVCLALWMAARVNSDSAKCIVIFWCLLAFIASGYEHSVANMTLLGLALAGNHPEAVSLTGFAWNLAWVTAGNAVGGAIFVAGAYWMGSPKAQEQLEATAVDAERNGHVAMPAGAAAAQHPDRSRLLSSDRGIGPRRPPLGRADCDPAPRGRSAREDETGRSGTKLRVSLNIQVSFSRAGSLSWL